MQPTVGLPFLCELVKETNVWSEESWCGESFFTFFPLSLKPLIHYPSVKFSFFCLSPEFFWTCGKTCSTFLVSLTGCDENMCRGKLPYSSHFNRSYVISKIERHIKEVEILFIWSIFYPVPYKVYRNMNNSLQMKDLKWAEVCSKGERPIINHFLTLYDVSSA